MYCDSPTPTFIGDFFPTLLPHIFCISVLQTRKLGRENLSEIWGSPLTSKQEASPRFNKSSLGRWIEQFPGQSYCLEAGEGALEYLEASNKSTKSNSFKPLSHPSQTPTHTHTHTHYKFWGPQEL